MSAVSTKAKKLPSASMRPPSQKGHPRSSSQGRSGSEPRSSSLPPEALNNNTNATNQDAQVYEKKKVVPRTIKSSSSKPSPYGQQPKGTTSSDARSVSPAPTVVVKRTIMGRVTIMPIQVLVQDGETEMTLEMTTSPNALLSILRSEIKKAVQRYKSDLFLCNNTHQIFKPSSF
jgi:hypothetical protein